MSRVFGRITLLAGLMVACGAAPEPLPAAAAPGGYAGVITLLQADAPVRVETGGRWVEMQLGSQVAGVSRIDAGARGAVLELDGEPGGRLWLQAGTRLDLGQAADGEISTRLDSGCGRLQTFLSDRSPLSPIGGDDVLLRPGADPRPTAAEPGAADWTLNLLREAPAEGVGTLSVGDDQGHVDLVALQVHATSNGDMVDVEVEHRFFSHAAAPVEGTFRFPLPAEAVLTGLAMEIGGQLMEGSLVERDKAQRIYDEIVDQMLDPAILEWEAGNVFKLRVFPIEPQQEKRVVLRYSVPLTRVNEGWVWRYTTSTPALKETIGRFTVDFDGRVVADVRDRSPGATTEVSVPTPAVAHAVEREGVHYTTVRVTPEWPVAPMSRVPPRSLVIFVDTSRSTLESLPLARESVRVLLESLRPEDRFALLSGDVSVRHHTAGAIAATPANVAAALAALAPLDADGASDLGAALRSLSQALAGIPGAPEVVYIGDGVATWGQPVSAESVSGWRAPFHAISLERDADTERLGQFAGATGGVVATPRTLDDVRRFALRLATTTAADRLVGVQVSAEGQVVGSRAPVTLFRGDSLAVSLQGETAPTRVLLTGRRGAEKLEAPLSFAVAAGGRADQRWAAQHLAALQAEKADKQVIVDTSLRFGVMSRYTAFLVLESEEAYAQNNIERPARIDGADLESDGAAEAQLSADHIQPGDPEVRVPAPADARSVWVFFPFGDVHQATWEPALSMWTTRFLISKETPDGEYFIRVRITHADGRVELLSLRYVVDTLKPAVEVRLKQRAGKVLIEARQLIRAGELEREGIPTDDLGAAQRRYAHVAADLQRVDVRLPDGQVLPLRVGTRDRLFRGVWTPRAPLGDLVTLTVVSHDNALNANPVLFSLDPTNTDWQLGDE